MMPKNAKGIFVYQKMRLKHFCMESPQIASGTVLEQAGGQIKFKVAPMSDSVTGKITFCVNYVFF